MTLHSDAVPIVCCSTFIPNDSSDPLESSNMQAATWWPRLMIREPLLRKDQRVGTLVVIVNWVTIGPSMDDSDLLGKPSAFAETEARRSVRC